MHVLRAPTGSKKSRLTRQKIVEAFAAGKLTKVIWAVHSTRPQDSLATEAHQHFEELFKEHNVTADVVVLKSRDDTTPKTYHAQLAWPDMPQVKIISFAHLPHVYARSATLSQLNAGLLVIDELPLTGLVHPVSLTLMQMVTLGHSGAGKIARRIAELMRARRNRPDQGHTVNDPADPRGRARQLYFTGTEFLQAVGEGCTEQDWQAFGEALASFAPFGEQMRFTDEWLSVFRGDVDRADLDSHRFGVTWKERDGTCLVDPQFYSSILTPLTGLPPTLILDAYADKRLYAALFPQQAVKVIHKGSNPPLQIEHAPQLKLYAGHMGRETADPHRLHIAEEILLLHQSTGQKVVLLVDKDFKAENSRWQRALQAASRHLNVLPPPSLHHFAGRGKNEFDGYLLVALSLAALPNRHHRIDLTALFPYPHDSGLRKSAHKALQAAERLQMFNRGRQPTSGARIVSAFDPELPESQCTLSPYQSTLPFTKQSNNPRWETAMGVVSAELVEAIGGVPQAFLWALDLIGANSTKTDGNRPHKEALTKALQACNLPPQSQLAGWLQTGKLPRFEDVKPYLRKDGRVNAVLTGLHLSTSAKNHDFIYGGQRVNTQIWVPKGGDELAVLGRAYPE